LHGAPPRLKRTPAAANAVAALFASLKGLRLLRSAVKMAQRHFSSSRSSYDMVGGFSFAATMRGFVGFA
jgi:hypothetical protein